MNSNNDDNLIDQATAERLAKLRAMPVDTSRLDRLIRNQIPRPRSKRWTLPSLMRPAGVVAAAVLIAVLVGVLMLSLSGGAVMAAPDTMAAFHKDLISGQAVAMQVDSIAEANKALGEQWTRSVRLPQLPSEHVMLCCMRTIKDKRVACVLLKSENGVPVTMAVARASDMKCPESSSITRDNITYMVHNSGSVNMVMAERENRWICLIGELPAERLINIAGALRF